MATYHRLESLMIYGVPGTGKTQGSISVTVTNPQATFHYLEADRTLDPVFEMFEGCSFDNIIRWPAFDYEEFMASKNGVIEILKNCDDPWNHWVIIDTIGHCYREIQNVYTMQMQGMMADALRESRMGKQGFSFDGFSGAEWAVIKRKFYNEFLWPLIRFHNNNSILIAHSRDGNGHFHPQAPTEHTERFQKLGQYPDVHKDVIRYLNTVLYFSNVDNFTFQTLKETGKRNWINEKVPFNDFWTDYRSLVLI